MCGLSPSPPKPFLSWVNPSFIKPFVSYQKWPFLTPHLSTNLKKNFLTFHSTASPPRPILSNLTHFNSVYIVYVDSIHIMVVIIPIVYKLWKYQICLIYGQPSPPPSQNPSSPFLLGLKEVFTKNEKGYLQLMLLILLLSVASIRRKLLKTSHTEERRVHTNSERCNIQLGS